MQATRSFDDVRVGDELPGLAIQMGLTGIMAAAVATRDYQPVHHDPDLARSLGNKDVFFNTHTTAGFLERFVMEWAGPAAFLKSVKFRMGTPNYAGDTLSLRGRVAECRAADRTVVVAVAGTNAGGTHVDGTVTVQLP